jgi:hypothetical protein
MCFTGTKSGGQPLVAKEDIKVYKIVLLNKKRKIISSIYHRFYWEVGKEVVTEMNIYDDLFVRVEEGLHSYSAKDTYIDIRVYHTLIEPPLIRICSHRPTYYVIDQLRKSSTMELAILKCVIPKDSKYFENDKGEMVSDTLKPVSCEVITFGDNVNGLKVKF